MVTGSSGPSIHGISQARIVEWVAISRGSSRPRGWTWVSCISRRILYHWATQEAPFTPDHSVKIPLAPLCPKGFTRQEYWSSLPFLSPVDHVLSESVHRSVHRMQLDMFIIQKCLCSTSHTLLISWPVRQSSVGNNYLQNILIYFTTFHDTHASKHPYIYTPCPYFYPSVSV